MKVDTHSTMKVIWFPSSEGNYHILAAILPRHVSQGNCALYVKADTVWALQRALEMTRHFGHSERGL